MKYEEIIKKYRLAYTKITNKSFVDGKDEFPVLPCDLETAPDYLCLYNNKKDYNKTKKTCVCFYEFDNKFDGINGLFNAIYYDDKKLLKYYKDRFRNVWAVIEPDYSQIRDIELIENKYRQFKARVVGLWFLTEMNIPVIPNINFAGEYSFEYMVDGIRNSKMLAISLKGIMNKKDEEELLIKVIKFVIDNTKVEKIIIYSTGIIDLKIEKLFEYAKEKGVEYFIPENLMRERNRVLNSKKVLNKK